MSRPIKYSFLIEGNGKRRKVYVRDTCPKQAEHKLKATIESDNRKKGGNTKIIEFVGIES